MNGTFYLSTLFHLFMALRFTSLNTYMPCFSASFMPCILGFFDLIFQPMYIPPHAVVAMIYDYIHSNNVNIKVYEPDAGHIGWIKGMYTNESFISQIYGNTTVHFGGLGWNG